MENEEVRIKLIKFGLVFLAFILVFLVIFFSVKKQFKHYIIFGNYLILEKNGSSFTQINDIDDEILKYKYLVSDGKKVYKDVKMKFMNNRFYLYDKNDVYINLPNFRAATYETKVSFTDYKRSSIVNLNTDKYVADFFDKNELKMSNDYKGFATLFDFDKDGEDEIIYEINNISLSRQNYEQKGYMFVVSNGSIIYSAPSLSNALYTVMDIVDIDNDGVYEVIVNKDLSDLKTFDSCYQIYKVKKGKWKIVKDC